MDFVQTVDFYTQKELDERGDFSSLDNIICEEGKPKCRIANVVCTYDVGVKLNLAKISLFFKDKMPVKYNPKKFAAMIVTGRVSDKLPMTTVLMFSTSKVVHTGSKTELEAEMSAWYLVYYLMYYLKIPASVNDFCIRNIVSYFDLGHRVDLDKLSEAIGGRAAFHRRLIHSCRVRNKKRPKQVLLIFVTGNIVSTGSKDREAVIENYKEALQLCAGFSNVNRHTYRFGPKKRDITVTEMEKNNDMLTKWDVASHQQAENTAPNFSKKQSEKKRVYDNWELVQDDSEPNGDTNDVPKNRKRKADDAEFIGDGVEIDLDVTEDQKEDKPLEIITRPTKVRLPKNNSTIFNPPPNVHAMRF